MSNRQISIRIGMEGGADVTRSIDEITRAGTDGFDRMAASWGKTGEAADKYKAQLQQIAEAAKQAALADEVNQSWSKFLGVSDQVTNSAREAAAAFKDGTASTVNWSSALSTSTEVLGQFGIALSAAELAHWTIGLVTSAAELENQAKILGISTEALQAYHAAAIESGAGADAGDAAIRRFSVSLGLAEQGSKLQAEAFQRLGISADALADGTEANLPKVASALLNIADRGEQARLAVALFGRSGQDVIELLEKLADPAIVENMTRAGFVIGDQFTKAAHDSDVAFQTFFEHLKTYATEFLLLGGTFSPVESGLAIGQILQPGPNKAGLDPNSLAGLASRAVVQKLAPPDAIDVTPLLPALAQAIETAKALNEFHDDVVKLLDEDQQAKKAAEDYQAVLDRAGITNVPANYKPGGRTALEAALDGIGTGGVPISINRNTDLSLVSTQAPRDISQGIGAASRTQLIPDEAQFATDRIVEKIQEEARIAALLPQYRQSELEVLNLQYRTHQNIDDAQRRQIEDAIELKIRNEEIAQTINQMQGDFANFLKTAETTGKLSFGSLFRSILSDWEDLLNKMIAQQAFQALFGGAAGGAGIGASGLFNSLDLAVGGPGLGGGGAGLLSDVFSSVFHSGGVAGDVAPTRRISPSFFTGAPRFHLGIDEVPAILQTGERVLSRSQAANYSASSGGDLNIHIHLDGANGDQQVAAVAKQAVIVGLTEYRTQMLARDVYPIIEQKIKQPRFRG